MSRALALIAVLGSVACAPGSLPVERSRDAIYGGVLAPNDVSVFILSSGCTAALIAPRTLLTAAHCVDNPPTSASNGLREFEGPQYRVTRSQSFTGIPGDWTPDLALVLLEQAPPVPALPWRSTGPPPQIGTQIRHVGYGFTEARTIGERRTVEVPIVGAASPRAFGISVMSGGDGKSICNGDSGGPALIRENGVETILAVHSYGVECGSASGSALVYPYHRFVETWLSQNEAPSCARDLRCVPNCAPVDIDCLCAADGRCSTECPDGDDPDCAATCRPDGVCSPAAQCPNDLDCLPLGTACLRETQCGHRLCLSDPQNPTRYCAVGCTADRPACPADFQCDVQRSACIKSQRLTLPQGSLCIPGELCEEGTRCAQPFEGPPSRCIKTCETNLQCPGASRCDFSVGVCSAPPRPTTLDAGLQWTGPAAPTTGCQQAPGALLLGLIALAGSRRRR